MKNKFNIIFLFLICSQIATAGGGWPQPKGWGYFKLSEWWLISDQHFTDVGQIDPNTTSGLFNTALYAEYGFTNRFTGVLYFPLYSRAYFNNTVSGTTSEVLIPGESINSIGDMNVGLKFGLTYNTPIAVSATLTFGIPLGNDNGGEAGALQTGDGEFNQIVQIDAGSGFQLGNTSAYANIYSGFNNRSDGFSDEFIFGLEGGVTVWKNRLNLIARLYGVESLKNGDLPSDRSNSTSVFANNAEHFTFSPEVAFNINEKWGISATYATAFRGELIFASPSYSLGVFFKLKK